MSRLDDAFGSGRWAQAQSQAPPPPFGMRAVPTQAVPPYYRIGGGVEGGCASVECITPSPPAVAWEQALPDWMIPRDAAGRTNLPSHVAFTAVPPPGMHAGGVGMGV
jgi:hypothetical protein